MPANLDQFPQKDMGAGCLLRRTRCWNGGIILITTLCLSPGGIPADGPNIHPHTSLLEWNLLVVVVLSTNLYGPLYEFQLIFGIILVFWFTHLIS